MIYTVAVILVLSILFISVGLLFPWSAYKKEQTFDHLLGLFWIGWALIIAFLQIWHLFDKVGGLAFLVVLCAGIVGGIRSGKLVIAQASGWNRGRALVISALILLPSLVLANHVQFAAPHYDHGMYHMPTVEWILNYAIVPGLGNLHHRFAFNNSNFLYAALVDWGPFYGRAYFIANALPSFILIVQCAAGFYQVFFDKVRPRIPHLFYAMMLPAVLWHLSQASVPGYSPDVPVFLLQAVLAGLLVRLFESGMDKSTFTPTAAEIILIAAMGITVKLSFAVSGALFFIAVAALWAARFGIHWRSDLPVLGRWAALAMVLIVPWLTRQVILSGYLIFPGTVLPFPVPWRIPADMAEPIAPSISLWAKTVNNSIAYTGDLNWFLTWARSFNFIVQRSFQFTLILAAADIGLTLWLIRKARPNLAFLSLFIISGLSLIYWFVMAPDYRFSGAMFWIFLVSALLYAFDLLVESGRITAPVFIFAALVMGLTFWLSPNHFSNSVSRAWLIMPPTEQQLAQKDFDQALLQSKTTLSGLKVYMPPAPIQTCYDAPLPCTRPQDFYSKLKLLDPSNMQKGFYIDRAQ